MFNVGRGHGEARWPVCWSLASRRQRDSNGSHRVAICEVWQVIGTMGFLNVALDHVMGNVARGKGGRGGEAYLKEANLLGRLRGRGLPIVHLEISASAIKGVA